MNNLFLETPPIIFCLNHMKILKELFDSKNPVAQKDLCKSTHIDKTTLSEAKQDLIKLGWCKEIQYGSQKEIYLEMCKREEIIIFFGKWHSLNQKVFLRPHSIILNGLIFYEFTNLHRAIATLSQMEDVTYKISHMNNNFQHIISTKYGSIILYSSGQSIRINIDNFVLPLDKSDIIHLEEYILQGILSRVNNIIELLSEVFKKCRIKLHNSYRLKNLHLGLICKKNISKTLLVGKMIKNHGLFADDSIYGVDEIEAHGDIDEVVSKISSFINSSLEAKISLT